MSIKGIFSDGTILAVKFLHELFLTRKLRMKHFMAEVGTILAYSTN